MHDRRHLGLRTVAVALLCFVMLTVTAGRASAFIGGCDDHGDGSDAARHYVCHLYLSFLTHDPTEDEVSYWITALSSTSTAVVAANIIGSAEAATEFVSLDYLHYVGRAGDPDGVAYWSGRLQAGLTLEDLVASMAATDEAYALAGGTTDDFVGYLYSAILDRSAGDPEIAYWSDLITNGATRGSVAGAFTHSPEYSTLRAANLYPYLDRDPDPDGLTFWSSYVAANGERQAFIAFLGSAEAYAVLSSSF